MGNIWIISSGMRDFEKTWILLIILESHLPELERGTPHYRDFNKWPATHTRYLWMSVSSGWDHFKQWREKQSLCSGWVWIIFYVSHIVNNDILVSQKSKSPNHVHSESYFCEERLIHTHTYTEKVTALMDL